MKRQLFESIKSMPYDSGQSVDRLGALSAVLAIGMTAADPGAFAVVSVTHAETETSTFEPTADERMFMNDTYVLRDADGQFEKSFVRLPVAANDLVNVEIDLVSCAQFIKINVEYVDTHGVSVSATATYTLTLGDYTHNPPQ